jgi:beta-phosphoglucomutase
MSAMHLRGILFDMDGVLCDSEALIAEAACRMFAERHGVQVRPEDFVPFIGTGEDRYLGGVARQYGVSLRMPGDKERVYALYLEVIAGRLRPLPGTDAFIAAARAGGWRLAVATSADRVKMEGNLREIGLPPDTFDACVTGEELEHKKPAPDIFLLAAHRIGVPARDCVVVEDAPNGVRAAKAAGARCLALTTSFSADALRAEGADWVAAGLHEISPDLFFEARAGAARD